MQYDRYTRFPENLIYLTSTSNEHADYAIFPSPNKIPVVDKNRLSSQILCALFRLILVRYIFLAPPVDLYSNPTITYNIHNLKIPALMMD